MSGDGRQSHPARNGNGGPELPEPPRQASHPPLYLMTRRPFIPMAMWGVQVNLYSPTTRPASEIS